MLKTEWNEFRREFSRFTRWTASGIIDALYLVIWALIQRWTGEYISSLSVTGIDRLVLTSFQILFAASTVIPIVIYMYGDMRVMLIKARRHIQREQEKDRKYDTT